MPRSKNKQGHSPWWKSRIRHLICYVGHPYEQVAQITLSGRPCHFIVFPEASCSSVSFLRAILFMALLTRVQTCRLLLAKTIRACMAMAHAPRSPVLHDKANAH